MSGTIMLIGGVGPENDDYDWLLKNEGKTSSWSCPKTARVGDEVLIYVAAPISKVFARAKVIRSPQPGAEVGSRWRYVGWIGPIRHLPSPIRFDEMQDLCPDWAWLRYPRGLANVPDREAQILLRRASKNFPSLEQPLNASAGFGDPETNRRVEEASINAVERYFLKSGNCVVTRERERVGYDLDVSKGRRTLHVEVKGVSGTVPAFIITRGEVECARKDPRFHLALVTSALNNRNRRIEIFRSADFLKRFALSEIAFMATLK